MKKVLTVLFGLLFLQNAYSDSLMGHSDLQSGIFDYMNDKMDEKAIRALCEKLLTYARMHNYDIVLETTKGYIFTPSISDCKSKDIDFVEGIIQGSASQLVSKTFENHSQCIHDMMEQGANLKCESFASPSIRYYENSGYEFNFSESIVDCSWTDNRCVVNRPYTIGGQRGFYTVCCSVPVYSCNQSNNLSTAQAGYVSVLSQSLSPKALGVGDFDFSCKPLNK